MDYVQEIGRKSKEASRSVQFLGQEEKNEGLKAVARELRQQMGYLLVENDKDVKNARAAGMKPALIDRLLLTSQRIQSMAEGLEQIAMLEDPVGRWNA